MQLPCKFGRYTLVERIACGGTAEVYRAVFSAGENFRKTVAVKTLLPSWGASDELRAMLVDEARALCQLAHQSIVQVFELGSEEGVPYLAMEYVDGLDGGRFLARLIREGRALPTALSLYVADQILTALEFAHRSLDAQGRPLGLVHRDISPSNILLSWNGEVKVTDFGIAKGLHRSQSTMAGQIRGKYAYMAPEQARGEPIDARADLFALGLCTAELALGHRLCEAATEVEVLAKAARAELRLDGLELLPAPLRALLMLSLAADRASRYQSAAEMREDVRRAERMLGEMGGSLELAAFLRELFPQEERRPAETFAVACDEGAGTRVLPAQASGRTAALADEGPAPWKRRASQNAHATDGRRGMRALFRAAALAVLFVGMSAVPKADGAIEQHPAPAQRGSPRTPAAREEAPAPPAMRGAVAIDSIPSGAHGTLSVGGMTKAIVTPVTEHDLDVGHGVDCRIELAEAGYAPLAESFRLSPTSAAFVKEYRLRRAGGASISVSAAPWGLVSVAGVASGRETPVNGLRVREGTYTVRVAHPPTGREVAARVAAASGQSRRCHASFGERATISCR